MSVKPALMHEFSAAVREAVISAAGQKRQDYLTGTVTQVDLDGTVWVDVTGGVQQMPIVRSTADCKPGDLVTFTIDNGVASIGGNASDISAGRSSVEHVEREVTIVEKRVIATEIDAQRAHEAAESAQADADTARQSADKATFALSDLENVVGTLEWIAEHGSYESTEDAEIVPGKVYYTLDEGVYSVVAEPSADELESYFELHLDESVQNYIASHLWLDDYGLNLSVDSADGYRIHQGTVDAEHAMGVYILDELGVVAASFGPESAQIGRDDDAHVLLADGKVIASDGDGNEAEINGMSMTLTQQRLDNIESYVHAEVVDGTPTLTLSAGEEGETGVKTVLTNSRLAFTCGDDDAPVAYIGEEDGKGKLFVENAVVVNELELGNWVWTPRANGNLALKWIGA